MNTDSTPTERPTERSAAHAPRLALGHVVATPGALDVVRAHGLDVLALVHRHARGDWGDIGRDDALANDLALDPACPARVLSAYEFPSKEGKPGGWLWVLTEADRSATTVLLPAEY
jgi:hypothetical protein